MVHVRAHLVVGLLEVPYGGQIFGDLKLMQMLTRKGKEPTMRPLVAGLLRTCLAEVAVSNGGDPRQTCLRTQTSAINRLLIFAEACRDVSRQLAILADGLRSSRH
jgi:hypothetical protein